MKEPSQVSLVKWPFFVGDGLLLLAAAVMVFESPHPLGLWQMMVCSLCVLAAAGFGIIPFVLEYTTSAKLAALDALTEATARIKSLENVAGAITNAGEQWREAQNSTGQMLTAARQLSDRMSAEVKGFCDFLQKANDQEKANLRLELDKLRRGEADWVQLLLRIFDHIYAVNQAAHRSNRPEVIEQLDQFQNACRDSIRRIGLLPFVAQAGDPADAQLHQPAEGHNLENHLFVNETLAPGYTLQGRLLRKALVTLRATREETPLSVPAQPGEEERQVDDAEPPPVDSEEEPDPMPAQQETNHSSEDETKPDGNPPPQESLLF